jgi:hypothetical protein
LDQPHIRRLPDGPIDYDFYRRKAQAERAAAIANFFAVRRRSGLPASQTFLARLLAAWKS